MDHLIEGLQILKKYMAPDVHCPTHCEHDLLTVMVSQQELEDKDMTRLDELGFFYNDEYGYWGSFRFGSA